MRSARLLLLPSLHLLACGPRDGGDATSGQASAAARPSASVSAVERASASPSAAASATGPAASGAPASGLAPIDAATFCARVVALGEANMKACAVSEQANIPARVNLKSLGGVGEECTKRAQSKNVEFHGDVAAQCLAAAEKRGGRTTFWAFWRLPACRGVVTGKAAAGQPALFGEECAPGLSFVGNRCVEPVGNGGDCDQTPGGLIGDPAKVTPCKEGLACFQTYWGADGLPLEFKCIPPQPIGGRCKLDPSTCVDGAHCYQGKCRERAAEGGECMSLYDCKDGLDCEIKGGVFGKCVPAPPEKPCGAK